MDMIATTFVIGSPSFRAAPMAPLLPPPRTAPRLYDNDLEPGGWLGHHRHGPAELYYVIHGEGTFTIDGTEHPVGSGTAAYVAGNSEHGIRNTAEGSLRFFYVFAVGSFDQVEYRFTAEQQAGCAYDDGKGSAPDE